MLKFDVIWNSSGSICKKLFNNGAQAAIVASAVLGIIYFINWFLQAFDTLGESHPIASHPIPIDFPDIEGKSYQEVADEYFKKDRSYGDLQRLWEEVVQAGDFNTENLGQRLIPSVLTAKGEIVPETNYPRILDLG